MNTQQQQAYINGFVKRASEHGLNHNEAIDLLKQAIVADAPEYQNSPSFVQGLKNLIGNSNPVNQIRATYQGLMGNPNAVNHPVGVPYMTGGEVGAPGLAGIPQRLSNAAKYMGTHNMPRKMSDMPMFTTPAK